MGPVFHPFPVFDLLQTRISQRQARRPILSILWLRAQDRPRSHSTCHLHRGSHSLGEEAAIWEAQKMEPNTGGGPARRLFVPHTVRSQVLHWAHIARFTCHPRVHRTIRFLQRYFRWPSLTRDAQEYVSACPVCTRDKPSSQPPAGQLHPLSTPSRPWSHIALDFVTGCYATV